MPLSSVAVTANSIKPIFFSQFGSVKFNGKHNLCSAHRPSNHLGCWHFYFIIKMHNVTKWLFINLLFTRPLRIVYKSILNAPKSWLKRHFEHLMVLYFFVWLFWINYHHWNLIWNSATHLHDCFLIPRNNVEKNIANRSRITKYVSYETKLMQF